MRGDDFNREFDARRARMDRYARINAAVGGLILGCAILAAVWCLTHPRSIGAFFGAIVAGFHGPAR